MTAGKSFTKEIHCDVPDQKVLITGETKEARGGGKVLSIVDIRETCEQEDKGLCNRSHEKCLINDENRVHIVK